MSDPPSGSPRDATAPDGSIRQSSAPDGSAVVSSDLFTIEVGRGRDGRTEISLRGELDVASSPRLEIALDQAADSAHDGGSTAPAVEVDLSEVTFIDSSGLRVLVRAAQRLEASGGNMRLAGTSPAVQRILEVTGLIERLRGDR